MLAVGLTPHGWWWLVPLGVAATVVAIYRAGLRQTAIMGASAGVLFTFVHLGWLMSVGFDALVAIAFLFGLWWAVMLTGVRLVLNLQCWPLIVPTVWVLQEWLRSTWPLGGFPWARLGYASIDGPLSSWIPIVGVYGMTYLMAALGAGLAALILCGGRQRVLAGVSLVAAMAVTAGVGIASHPVAVTDVIELEVAVVQGGPQPGIDWRQKQAVLSAHVNQTRTLAARSELPIDLVLWPESSTDIDPLINVWAQSQISSAAQSIGAPIIVGAVTEVPGETERVRNQAIVWSPTMGAGASYTKQKLVPFGEYVPNRGLLKRLSSRLTQVPRDFVTGEDPPVLQVGPVVVGVLICFEVAFDELVRSAIDAGATVLALPSNNATYLGTAQPGQQLAIARFRAVETSRAVLVASTTGVSAIVDSAGRVVGSLEDGAAGTLRGSVTLSNSITTAVRWGGVIEGVLILVSIVLVAAGALRHRRSWTRM